MVAVKLDDRHAAFQCKVAGCDQWVAIEKRLLLRDPTGISIQPFVTMCPSGGWIQRIQPADVVYQSESDVDEQDGKSDGGGTGRQSKAET
jgi:hypothetical protein